jgi:hypothetical protein
MTLDWLSIIGGMGSASEVIVFPKFERGMLLLPKLVPRFILAHLCPLALFAYTLPPPLPVLNYRGFLTGAGGFVPEFWELLGVEFYLRAWMTSPGDWPPNSRGG